MKQVVFRPVDKHKYAIYWNKATEFYAGMKQAEENGNWNLACLNAIHCAISSVDAIATFYLKQRSAGQRHEDAASLLQQTGLPQAKETARQLLDILSRKNLVEYDAQEPTRTDAHNTTRQAEKIYKWAQTHLKT